MYRPPAGCFLDSDLEGHIIDPLFLSSVLIFYFPYFMLWTCYIQGNFLRGSLFPPFFSLLLPWKKSKLTSIIVLELRKSQCIFLYHTFFVFFCPLVFSTFHFVSQWHMMYYYKHDYLSSLLNNECYWIHWSYVHQPLT